MDELEQPQTEMPAEPALSVEELMASRDEAQAAPSEVSQEDTQLKAVLEAIIYVAEEPLTLAQISASLQQPAERIRELLAQVIAELDGPGHGISIREVAGGYKMATKPEHHEAVRDFVKSLKPPLKLSLPALETLAVIAYKQPVTGPEIQAIRGVQGSGVMRTLLERKLVSEAGRKNVIGRPLLYKTTKEFLIQFGLKDLSELPSLKEFEEIRRMAFSDAEPSEAAEVEAQPELPLDENSEEMSGEAATEPATEATAEADAAPEGQAEAAVEAPEAPAEAPIEAEPEHAADSEGTPRES
jgi:segregation and condensation protein B